MPPESNEVRVWLVEHGYNNRDLILLKHATPDGSQIFRKEVASQALDTVSAAKEASDANLETVEDPAVQERYADEAARMAEKHDSDDPV
ncbi:hypothetical protein [Natrialba sp. SSL1]|uniref:hypothetical protein n=1 Tax=Natrialba sp. SSL1 TaxID=1869245 RepID=UPI0008F90F6F|nr:hypothetical protein [Natrialba sp. SSL1]OIB57363.1 hypothetical protein BBD46_02460 [Natrialba sp. SSL1]